MKKTQKHQLTSTELLDKLFPKMEAALEPKISKGHKSTIHKDGTVSFWCIYNKVWKRLKMEQIPPQNLASFSFAERIKIVEKLIKNK